jgi:hypothetical protein
MWKLNKVRGPWETEASEPTLVTRAGKRTRQPIAILIEIEPLCVVYRIKGTRRRFRLPHSTVFQMAVRAEVESNRRTRPHVRRSAVGAI